jgi:imidazolonepropionase-like amidohydrolase
MEMEVPKGQGKARKGEKRSRTSGGTTSTMAVMVERKEVERERRQHMKQLCTKLASLIPTENFSSTVRINYVLTFFPSPKCN